MRKRIAAGLLAFALAFTAMDFGGLVSIQANAAGLVQVTEENQSNFHLNGDYAGYYAIADKEDLQAFAAKVNAGENAVNAVLTADIDMTGEDWTPIGDTNDGYTGIFDGNGHKISKLVCERTGDKQVSGLFAQLKSWHGRWRVHIVNEYGRSSCSKKQSWKSDQLLEQRKSNSS